MSPERLVYKVWQEGPLHFCGTVSRETGKPHGILRSIACGKTLVEYQVEDGRPHGFERTIGPQGHYETRVYQQGKLLKMTSFHPDNSISHEVVMQH